MGKKIVTNEELCSALLTHGTIKKAACALNISERTVYNMMNDRDFKQLYKYSQSDILSNSVTACQSKMTESIDCIAEIMNDKNVNPQTRLQAAQAMLKNTVYMSKLLDEMRDFADRYTWY